MITRVLLVDEAHAWEDPTLIVSITTDIPSHSWLRWTDVPERMHLRAAQIRGEKWVKDPKYCFVAWLEVEQAEPGDTLTHTFEFGPWAEGDERWWWFRFEVDSLTSPSNTPIWHETFHAGESVISLGILTDPIVLVGHVKLTPGPHVNLTFDVPGDAIIVEAT